MKHRSFLTRLAALLFAVAASLATTAAHAQQQQPDTSAEQQQLQDQMRQNFGTIMQNMQAKGIDPQQFFSQMRQGTDMADIQKQMIDQGILDPQTAAQMQATAARLTTLRLRDQLLCSDAEWAVMDPLIQKVIAASNAVGGGGGRMGGFVTATASPAAAALSKARKALHAAIADTNTTPDQFASLLKDLRDARDQAKDELRDAQRDLIGVLNVRQEAALTQMGLFD